MKSTKSLIISLFLCYYFVDNGTAKHEKYIRSIHGFDDPPQGNKRTFIIEKDLDNVVSDHYLQKRSTVTSVNDTVVVPKMNYLKDGHKQLMVHWVGEGSNVIICLARDPTPTIVPSLMPIGPSAVYISYDYGDTYENKTDLFKMSDGNYSTLEKFYNHPKYNTHFVFADVKHKLLYVTTNHGRDIKRIELNFTPSDILFHELLPSVFVVLDKNDLFRKLWVTEDFGNTFRSTQNFVKAFYWIKENDLRYTLVIQRMEPNGYNTILYSNDLFSNRSVMVYDTNVKDFYVKGDYLFTTKISSKGVLELYVSYKLGKRIKCVFDTNLEQKNYFIVDVTSNRALIAVSHSDTISHLYVSENLDSNYGTVKFTLSLEDVLCYFPNSTWHDTWIHHVSEEAFADVYKVEGLTGIYIASRVLTKPQGNNLGPQHLGSVITFDHGRSWRLLVPPERDIEGQLNPCSVHNNCSLHLSQKFSQLNPDTRSISILSSKSAPGIIIATGVLGKSLKGHYGVYISDDAGLTWRQTLRDLYFFNMGDHGGILAAVKYFKLRGETRHILYSTDEGENWQQAAFHDQDIRLYGLMTEPGENTTVFTMFGSLPQEHQWIIVKLDLRKAFKYNCTKDDYKTWSPSQSDGTRNYIPCVMGQQVTYQRRMPHANCYNGEDFDAPISMMPCGCDIYDYECDFGFIRSEKPGNCVRNTSIMGDPYRVPLSCKPGKFYNRTKGYRKIQGDVCVDGFENHYKPEEIPCPFNEVEDFLLFAQRERISRFNLVTRTLEELPVKKLKNVIAIDFDLKNNCVYWADIALDTIGRQCLNSSESEILVSSDLASIEGMAFDWISNNLYFVDGVRSKIELIRTDINHSGRMRRTILGADVLKKPRGIALHPKAGYMFWTDWSVENPSVNRADLDGKNILKLFGKPIVEWPNGITIDYIAERIYWVDARQDYIASSDLHGDYFKKIISHDDVVSHPFAVAVFKNDMYWDDWKRNAIFSADKDGFRGVEVLRKQLPGLMDLKVYAHGIQVGTNACTNTTCPYVCVGKPKKDQSSCLCPDGMEYNNGNCLCPGHVHPLANFTCPRYQNTCSGDHFVCGNGFCVPKGWKCDGEDDCGDNSDELNCGTQTCPPNYFVCGDGKCLPQYWRCDYDYDCLDGSDEKDCPRKNCTENQFTCNNGRCIASKWKCDGENDCRDGSDEINCDRPETSSCKNDEFECKAGGIKCIPPTWQCDGEKDCRDGADELNCNNNTCLDIQFSCGGPQNRCIYSTWVCDGDKDCPNGRDEMNCTSVTPDRSDVTDQFIPKNGSCQDWMFKCANQKCIPYWWKCDDANDCGDGSDEVGCPVSETTTLKPSKISPRPTNVCDINQYQCASGGCIFSSWVCDGMEDCSKGEDEQNCFNVAHCTKDQFRCRKDGSCVPLSVVCNQHNDCPDGTDELECIDNLPNIPAAPSCPRGYFLCDGDLCQPLANLCNGKTDCADGYDEFNCSKVSRIYQVLQMGVDERGINESSLLLYWWIATPSKDRLEFLPSISKAGVDEWRNETWTEKAEFLFKNLQPSTKYNMTVYVRVQNTSRVFLPAKYFIAYTREGVPSGPWNVTAVQKNGSHVLLSWNPPAHPNGQIVNYQICWSPPTPAIKMKLSGNETSHLLLANFEPGVKYSFYVTALNKKYESERSEVATLLFDTAHDIQHLTILKKSENSVTLSWKYNKSVESFQVEITPDKNYPRIPPRITKEKTITVNNLAPGAQYTFAVSAFKKTFHGPKSHIMVVTDGTELPTVTLVDGKLLKDVGTSVKLSWAPPKDSKKTKWTYGIYYGIDVEELFEKPRVNTTNLSVTINNLQACEEYTFRVGVVAPFGFGPLSESHKDITTSLNKRAPAKNLTVEQGDNALKMKIHWSPSCPFISNPVPYIIRVYERILGNSSTIRTLDNGIYTRQFDITYGAIYDISVGTDDPDAIYTPNVTYYAPVILPPFEVKSVVESNGSFFVYWQERNVPAPVGPYKYEVLVNEGNATNETTAEKFLVAKPPFIYTNTSANMYTFAVRILADSGYKSLLSEQVSKTAELFAKSESVPASTNSYWVIAILTVLALLIVVAFGIFIVKHRRLQNSFTRFANSHYDTRSGAATFEDNGLEEEDSPQITGFSDDEPLVIA